MDKVVKVLKIGKINYANGLKLQKYFTDLHHKNKDSINDTMLLLEHDPVYTVGIRRKDYSKIDEDNLKKLGADFYQTNRGGLITFHGPGQLVAYPIINLKNFKPSIRWYVCSIEQTIIELCHKLNLTANTSPHTGVWINDNKVCAIGVHCSRYVTSHGLALNCNTDLSWYKHIVPCGIPDKGVTSLSKELRKNITTTDIEPLFVDAFSEIFKCSVLCESVEQKLLHKIISA